MKLGIVFVISSLLLAVVADFSFSSPDEGDSFSGSGGQALVQIKWTDDSDDGDDFSLANVKTVTISLCSGPASSPSCFLTVQKPQKLSGTSFTATIQNDAAPDGNYFFQFYAVFAAGTSIHYTSRFKLTSMSGPVGTLKGVTATGDSPDPQTSAESASIDSASFSIAYTAQTGKTRYAPMQTQPGSKVTMSAWSRRFPTSSYTPYSTLQPSPNVHSTITPGWDYTPASLTNTAAPAAYPTSFYAASSRVSKATLSSAAKKKRWLD